MVAETVVSEACGLPVQRWLASQNLPHLRQVATVATRANLGVDNDTDSAARVGLMHARVIGGLSRLSTRRALFAQAVESLADSFRRSSARTQL